TDCRRVPGGCSGAGPQRLYGLLRSVAHCGAGRDSRRGLGAGTAVGRAPGERSAARCRTGSGRRGLLRRSAGVGPAKRCPLSRVKGMGERLGRTELAARIAAVRERIDRLPRVRLAHLPTPLDACPRLSAQLGGPALWVKRDDCTGLAFGGNKSRQLEFTLGDAV